MIVSAAQVNHTGLTNSPTNSSKTLITMIIRRRRLGLEVGTSSAVSGSRSSAGGIEGRRATKKLEVIYPLSAGCCSARPRSYVQSPNGPRATGGYLDTWHRIEVLPDSVRVLGERLSHSGCS
jgi:hypothetical protein